MLWAALWGVLLCLSACGQPLDKTGMVYEAPREGAALAEEDAAVRGSREQEITEVISPEPESPEPPSTEAEPETRDLPREPEAEGARVPEEDPLLTLAREHLALLSREERCGQLLFARCPEGDAAALAGELCLGGYIFFGRDFKNSTPEAFLQKERDCSRACPVPLLLGVDEEGGTVVRASYYPAFRGQKFLSPQKLYARGGLEALREDAAEKSAFLQALGLNVNLAPVCDVCTQPGAFLYDRTLGQGAEETGAYVSAVVEEMVRQGMGSVLKHFPGYGNCGDTHSAVVVDQRPLETFLAEDLLPFRAGVQSGAGAVLVCHNVVTCLNDRLPASLAPEAYRLLREELGFDGVAMTDDLDMGAVSAYAEDQSAAVLALNAGADLLICGDPRALRDQILNALDRGDLAPERVEEAALRVLYWKASLGLLREGDLSAADSPCKAYAP